MASKGDLDLKITADASEVTTAMAETRSQLDQTITTINVQDQTWKSLAVAVVESTQAIAPSVAQITTAVAGLAGTIAVINHQKSMIAAVMSPLTSLGSAFVSYGGMAASAIGLIAPQWKLVTTAVSASLLVYKLATSEMAESAYKAAKGNADIEASTGRLRTAVGGLGTALAAPFGTAVQGAQSLVDAINPFPYLFGKVTEIASGWIDIAATGIESLTPKVVAFGDVLSTVAFVTSSLGTATADSTAAFYEEAAALRASAAAAEIRLAAQEAQRPLFKQLGEMQDSARESAQRTEEAAKLGSLNTVAAIDEEIRALQAKAAQSILTGDAVKKSQQAATLQNTAKELKVKADAPKASADDKKAYADAQASADAYTKPLEEAAKHQARLFSILEDRKSGIESGRIKPPESSVASAIKSAEMATLALAQGQDAVTIATERAKGATEEELSVLRDKLEQNKQLKASQEESKAIADLMKKSADDDAATQQRAATQIAGLTNKIDLLNGSATQAEIALRELASQGFTTEQAETIAGLNSEVEKLAQQKTAADKVTGLKDQIELLSGVATEAEIAMRELGRAGFTEDQIAEIGALTDQLNALKESQKKQPKEKAEKDDSPKVALQGSKEAAEIMLRGVGGGNKIEEIAQKQLTEQQKMVSLLSKPQVANSAKQGTQQPPTNPVTQQPTPQQPQMVASPVPFALPPAPVFSTPVIPPLPEQPEPLNAQPAAIASRPIPIQTPLVARSVLPTPVAAQIPTPQVAQSETATTGTDFGGGAFDYSGFQSANEALEAAVHDAIDAGSSIQEAAEAGVAAAREYRNSNEIKTAVSAIGPGGVTEQPTLEPQAIPSPIEPMPLIPVARAFPDQPARVLPSMPSSVAAEPVARSVVATDAIPPAPEIRNVTIANVPVTKPIPGSPKNIEPALPSMPNWEQHALAVQQSLVSGLSDGQRLSAADDNVPIDQAAFPETSFKPNIKPIDVSTPDVAAIDIPSPVVSVPEQSQIAIPSPIVSSPTVPEISIPSPQLSAEEPRAISLPSPTVTTATPEPSTVSIPSPIVSGPQAPTVPPVNVPSPLVNVGLPSVSIPATPNIAIAAPNISAPVIPPVSIPSPAIQAPTVEPISLAAPEVNQAQAPAVSAVDIPSPIVNVAQPKTVAVASPTVPPINVPSPSVNVGETPTVAIASPTVPPINVPSPMVNVGTPPSVSVASPTVPPVSIPAPSVTAATPQPISIPSPHINTPQVPDVSIPSPSVNLANTPPINIAPPEVSIAPLPLRPITLDAPEVSIAGLSPITIPTRQEQPSRQTAVNTVSNRPLVPTVAATTFAETPVPSVPELTIPTPKMPSLSIPELPRAKPPSLEKYSGMSARVESSLRSGPSNDASNLRNLEKLAASQLAELKNQTAAVKANKPQQLAAGSV